MKRKRVTPTSSAAPAQPAVLQRACACGQHTVAGGECASCQAQRLSREGASRAGQLAAWPAIVGDVLASPGQPLDRATRADLEPRLGEDFSRVPARGDTPRPPQAHGVVGSPGDAYERAADAVADRVGRAAAAVPQPGAPGPDLGSVRVHTDGRAAASAEALDARAYTVGDQIVFGAQQYAPGTSAGRHLLAHELAHVVQQRGGAAGLQRQPVGQAPASTESRAATTDEQREFVRDQISFLESSADHFRLVTRLDEAMLLRQLDSWRRMLESAAQTIRDSLGNDQTLLRDLRAAYTAAVRAIVTTAAARLGRTTNQLYQANRERIHEWGWPQGIADTTANQLTDALPLDERQRIRVVTMAVTIAQLENAFHERATAVPLPQNVVIRFASGVRQWLQRGLSIVAGLLTTQMHALEPNSTITLALDLEPFGGDFAAYRFTYVERQAQSGQRTGEVLVERLGSIGMEGMPPSSAEAARRRFDQHGFRRDASLSDAQFEEILATLLQVPDATLAPVRSITFRHAAVHPTLPDRCGEYDAAAHTITLFNCAFQRSMTRFGQPGQAASPAGVSTVATLSIAHEIGHAVDLRPLRQAWARLTQAQGVLRAAFAQFERPPGSGQYRFPNSEEARWNRLRAQVTAAEQARDQARAHSGARWQRNAAGVYEPVQGPIGAENSAFRQAALQDSGVRITRYADREWQEYFAEAYATYINAPETLRRLRPRVFAFFEANFPRQ
jgi:hypothetical protein